MSDSAEPSTVHLQYMDASEVGFYLTIWARMMAARFNGPVYLCGSIARDHVYPRPGENGPFDKPTARDVDIRIVISDAEFIARYGPLQEHPSPRWIQDMAKLGSELTLEKRFNIDFQIEWQSRADAYHQGQPAVLLAAPMHWLDANPEKTK